MAERRARRAPKLCFVLVSIIALMAGPGMSALGGGHYSWRSSEKCMMNRINSFRADNGLRSLKWDKQLGYVARDHAESLASAGGVWHDDDLYDEVTRWHSLGQNTGRGGKCKNLFKAFKASGDHRANMLGKWKFIGVGAEWQGGRLYVQQVFENRRNPGNIYHRP
jgi:uncharacterized protein YkwD